MSDAEKSKSSNAGRGQQQQRGSGASAHAPSRSVNAASPPAGRRGGSNPSATSGPPRRGHQSQSSLGSAPGQADPSQAMNHLQHLIQDMKVQQQPGGSAAASSAYRAGERDAQAGLSALGDRLAAQEEQLQTQLQQQLNLQSLSSRPGALASVGEHAEMGNEGTQQPPSSGRQGGAAPRFAGNAAFQSAMARHSQSGRSQSQDMRSSLAHQRQLSLQGRFAELGYTPAAMGNLGTIAGGDYEDGTTDDGSSVGDFMGAGGFDPTRQSFTRGHMPHASVPSYPTSQDYVAEQLALQQQIEMLQIQQQQLLQQQVQFNPSVQMGGQPQVDRPSHHGISGMAGHRRIQSHAPQLNALHNFNAGGIGSIGSVSNQQAPAAGRGHNRRHSTNVVKAGGATGAGAADLSLNLDTAPLMQPNMGFSFPNTASLQQQQQMPAAGLPTAAGSQRGIGHVSHPSVQLASTLSPEYLMAGGGLLNLSSLTTTGTELADGFSAGRGGGHGRTGSQSWRINGAPGPAPVADLAQAQAQLASLHQFRTQAGPGGGGHAKQQSYSGAGGFPPHLMGQFSPAGGFMPPGQQQQHQGGGGATQRKALFGSYLPQASLPPLLAAGKIVVGQIRVDKRNRSDAYVSTEVLESDIYISGSRDRNRALSGDIVAVELLDPQEVWLSKKAKEDKKKYKEEQGAISRKPDKAKDDVEVEGAQLGLITDEEDTEQAPPALAGHVVAIVERTPGQLFCGTIGLLRPSSAATKEKQQAERAAREGPGAAAGDDGQSQQRPKIVWHRPLNKTTPLIAIPADQAPEAFWEPGGQEKYASIMVSVAIKRWPITSLHPFGTLIEEIGVMGNVEAETQAILQDNLSSATEEFSESALKCVPPSPFTIPEREYEVRRDFRQSCVFTIDPSTAKDLDDAVSVTHLDGGLIEVGVHIADVSHFVKMNSALDREARKRCTSVYLVQRAIPMLPPRLSEELCSLVPNVERLCFSAVFVMNKDARIIGNWFGRTIIKSCGKLAYSDAQSVIETGSLPDEVGIEGPHTREKVAEDITTLHQLAKIMRERRFDGGALKINNVKLNFKLDDDGLPIDASVHKGQEANQLIEEFMLAANTAVSQRIAAGMPDLALLRRHGAPIERRLKGFARRAKQMGFDIDVSSAGALYASLEKISDRKSRFALESLATKGMLRAKYFCAGMTDISKFGHYALNVPVYTHFTSPIRRYADVMVHRQLDAVLSGASSSSSSSESPSISKFPIDREGMAKIAQQCNVKRDAAKAAQEASQHLFLCLMIHDLTMRYGPVVREATVVGVLDAAFDIVVPEFGIEKRVHVDQMPIQHHTHQEHDNSLSVYWRQEVDTIQWLAESSDDASVKALWQAAQRAAATSKSDSAAPAIDESMQTQRDDSALFEDDDDDDDGDAAGFASAHAKGNGAIRPRVDAATSAQHSKSKSTVSGQKLTFEGLSEPGAGHHKVQTVRILQTIPVVISATVGSKSPPVLTVFAVNPYA
ncbi:RNB-domain-containing protein [Jaminaea rosea]|uniref:DIS3-like exonuclease 2 n=1 Tax=Jaminaea rosea TaxID=1569628 RepID=A0A316US49_9BASI|nr:RNB-domain-containing protein [Jaminaea rosea]PWN28112.1 RNB-domain-containing protein [Jaminaea rosea]